MRASNRTTRHPLLVACLCWGALVGAADDDTASRLTLQRIFSTPSLGGTPPSEPVWSPDSRRIAFGWNDAGQPERSLWVVERDGSGLRRVAAPDDAAASVRDLAWLPDGETIVTLRGPGLWSTTVDDGATTHLAEIGAGASDLSVAPDGRRLAWLQGGDLWLYDRAEGSARRATDIGIGGLSSLAAGRYSRPEREIGPGIWSGPTYAWSPDGRHVAVHVVDRRGMRKVPFPNYLAAETDPNFVRRGYPGDANESRTVGLLHVAARKLEFLDLAEPTSRQVIGFSWSPGNVLLLDVASDTNVDRWLYRVEPEEGDLRELWHEHRPSRIYTAFASAWHPDGEQVVFLSDRADRYGLYALDPSAEDRAPRRLSDPGHDVLAGPDVVAASGEIFYAANGTPPYDEHVFRVRAGGAEPVQVTDRPGRSRPYPSPDGKTVAVIHSSDTQPPELFVVDADGGELQRITRSPPPAFSEIAWVEPRYVHFPSRIDDHTLHARILTPPDFDAGRRYPVLFGPVYSNTARNRWDGRYGLVQQLLAQRGYLVVQVDVRGSTGYGRDFREAFLVDFAGDDLEDLASAAAYLKTLPYVDPRRFGLWGSSYGGTLTVYMLLTKPGLFCAGAAAAAAVDPHFFGTDDVAIVRSPDTHPAIFERAAHRHAAKLEDHLLLIHGMQDHVVPFKTVAVLADALIRAGKDFDFAIAPAATHGWTREPQHARYLFGKLIEHFDRYLLPDDACRS